MTGRGAVVTRYSQHALAYRNGPGPVYAQLADAIVRGLPCTSGSLALDVGAGTGAATTALERTGARVVATDLATGMLRVDQGDRPPCATADVRTLPFRDRVFDVVVAAFVLNHLEQPGCGLREMARVTRPGGCALATTYASVDDHPAKSAVLHAATELGWQQPSWARTLRNRAMPRLATIENARAELDGAGLEGNVDQRRVHLADLDAASLVEWRLGMVDMASFVANLDPGARTALHSRAVQLLCGDCPPLVRTIIVITLDV